MPERPRWESENWVLQVPDEEKIVCRDCVHRAPDVPGVVKGARKGICSVYPVVKPSDVLWKNASCLYHLGEDE